MKNIFKERKIHIACVCLLLVMLLAGCSNLETDNQETDLFDVLKLIRLKLAIILLFIIQRVEIFIMGKW